MRIFKKIIMFGILLAIFLSAAQALPVYATPSVAPAPIPRINSLPYIQEATQRSGNATRNYIFQIFAGNFLGIFLGICAIASVIFIIVGGLQMHLALGNEEAIGKAKKTLIWAVAGLLISILSAAIVKIVVNLPLGTL